MIDLERERESMTFVLLTKLVVKIAGKTVFLHSFYFLHFHAKEFRCTSKIGYSVILTYDLQSTKKSKYTATPNTQHRQLL